jgi:serine/threonine-protein kinase
MNVFIGKHNVISLKRHIPFAAALMVFAIFLYGSYTAAGIFPFFKDIPNQGEMVLIPAGEFIMGSSEEEIEKVAKEFGKRGDFVDYDFKKETPKKKVYVKAFYIDRYEVTNAQYKRFIDATGHRPPLHWENGAYPSGKEKYPVINVSWHDAKAYALWTGKRLPTEEEWEKAARGADGYIYPWGNEFNPDNVRTAEALLATYISPRDLLRYAAPVDEFKKDRSPYGVYDTAGNVMEWTDSWYQNGKTKVVKGAAWVHLGPRARSASKEGAKSDAVSHLLGFRCAIDADKGIKTADIKDRDINKHLASFDAN